MLWPGARAACESQPALFWPSCGNIGVRLRVIRFEMISLKAKHIATLLLTLLVAATAWAQDNDKVLNRLYADQKPIHFGFSVGLNFQDLNITNNGFVTEDGESWFADIPDHSPGFCVNVLADLRLSRYFNLRFSPGMYFGNKVVMFNNALPVAEDVADPARRHQRQNVKATYVVLPLELKYSSLRYHNLRPYFLGGVLGAIDVAKEHNEQLKLKNTNLMLTVGFGCDIYLPYFKLCPEVKFCFGLRNLLDKNRPDLQDNPEMMRFTQSVDKVKDNMVVVTFYFE